MRAPTDNLSNPPAIKSKLFGETENLNKEKLLIEYKTIQTITI
jgi:hypothetical protein